MILIASQKYDDGVADADADDVAIIFISQLSVVLQNIFKFWLDKGVDALSINDILAFYESDDTALDEPAIDDEALPVSLCFSVQFCICLLYTSPSPRDS